MVQPQIYAERMLAQKTIEDLRKGIFRFEKEIFWFKTEKVNNCNQLLNNKWKIRHKEISIAFMLGKIDELNHRLKVLEVLYGN